MKCPVCAEDIRERSAACPHCREFLGTPAGRKVVGLERAEQIGSRVRTCNLLSFVFGVPGLGLQIGARLLRFNPELTPMIELAGSLLLIAGLGL